MIPVQRCPASNVPAMIDLHCHVLPGIDDGPGTVPGSLALARAAVAAGTTTLVATPHVSSRYPTDAATIAAGVRDLSDRLAAAGVTLELLGGAEIALPRLADIPANELTRLSLAGNGWLLVEPPFTAARLRAWTPSCSR